MLSVAYKNKIYLQAKIIPFVLSVYILCMLCCVHYKTDLKRFRHLKHEHNHHPVLSQMNNFMAKLF